LHGLENATDNQLWDFAAKQGYCIVSKDSDFLHLALLRGAPPKVIIVRTGNASTAEIHHCLLVNRKEIEAFYDNNEEAVLVIS